MKHILFITGTSYPCNSNMYMDTLASNLPSGYTASVVYADGGHRGIMQYLDIQDNVVTSLCHNAYREDWGASVTEYIDEYAVDVVVTTSAYYSGNDVYSGIKTIHNMSEIIDAAKSSPKVVFAALEFSGDVASESKAVNADVVITSSKQFASLIDGCDVTPSIIYGGAYVPPIGKYVKDIREYHGIPHETLVVGYIGELENENNVKPLVDACRSVGARLLVAGYGKQSELITDQKDMGYLTPIVPTNRRAWYDAFDVFVYPTKSLSFPFMAVEAMLCDTPVVMTPVSDFYSLTGGKFADFVYPTKEGIAEGIKKARQRRHISDTKDFAEKKFSIDAMVAGFIEAIQ